MNQVTKNKASFFLKSIGQFSIASWVNFGMGIIAVFVGTRIFAPEIYGILNLFNTAAGTLGLVACFGLNTAMLRFFYEPPNGWDAKQLFVKCMMAPLAFFMLLGCIAIPFGKSVSLWLFQREDSFLVVLLLLKAISGVVLTSFFAQYYRMMSDSRHYTVLNIMTAFFSQIIVLLSVFVSNSVETVLFFATAGLFLLMIVWVFVQRRQVFSNQMDFDFHGFAPVMRFAMFAYPSSLLVPASLFMISMMISQQLGSRELGVYVSANFIVSAFAVIQNGFRIYWAAFIYRHYREEREMIRNIHDYVGIFIFCLLGIFIVGQHVIYLFIGNEFRASRMFFTLVLVSPFLELWAQTVCYGIMIAQKNEQNLIISLLSTAIQIWLTLLLLPNYGLIAVAGASAFAGMISFVLQTWRGQLYYRSIESFGRTVVGLMLFLTLSVSNCIFWDHYWYEFGIVILLGALFCSCYHEKFQQILVFAKTLW